MENETRDKQYREKDGEYVTYYCAINEPIAEIVILNYFAKFAKVEKIPNMFKDDFSINYKIEILISMIDAQCLLCYMFLNKYIIPPATFGVVLSDVFSRYNQSGLKTDIEKVFALSYENYKKANPNATIDELNKFKNKGIKSIETYKEHDRDVGKVVKILKSRINSDKCKVMEKYSKTYPLQAINKDRYYVSYVLGKKVQQYIGDNCPKYLYYYMFENQKKYEKEYGKILLSLKEQGLIKTRWKNEFSLYLLVKSYFSSAIFQYHAEWLEKQSLDIYIPEHKIGIEYQGIQHFEEIAVFNGTDGLRETQKRDKLKKEKCKHNGVKLIEWAYTDDILDSKFIEVLKKLNIPIPQKQEYKMDEASAEIEETSKQKVVKICQYDLSGNYISSYESVLSASEKTGISEESIRRVCSGIRNTGGGYIWKRYLEDEIPHNVEVYSKEKKINGPRKIIQYSMEGEIITIYDSVSEAVRQTGINSKSIRETARGKQKHAGGYVWKYADNE